MHNREILGRLVYFVRCTVATVVRRPLGMATEEELLQNELQWLSKNLGVRRPNLNKAMRKRCPTLWRFWHLSTEDRPNELQAKVILYLEQLIDSQLQYAVDDKRERGKYERYRIVAPISYNIPAGLPRTLETRREWMTDRYTDLSPRTSERFLDEDIIPKFASGLASNPPSPIPPEKIRELARESRDDLFLVPVLEDQKEPHVNRHGFGEAERARVGRSELFAGHPLYIDRESCLEELNGIRHSGFRLALVGDSGQGRSCCPAGGPECVICRLLRAGGIPV
jgi:hypothetical protein